MALPKLPSFGEELKSDLSKNRRDKRASNKIDSGDKEGSGMKLPKLSMSFDDDTEVYVEPELNDYQEDDYPSEEVYEDAGMPSLDDFEIPSQTETPTTNYNYERKQADDVKYSHELDDEFIEESIEDESREKSSEGIADEVVEESWESKTPEEPFTHEDPIIEEESVEDVIGNMVDEENSVNQDEEMPEIEDYNVDDYQEESDSDFVKIENEEEDTLKELGDESDYSSIPAYNDDEDLEGLDDYSEEGIYEGFEPADDEFDDGDDDYLDEPEELEEQFSFLPGIGESEQYIEEEPVRDDQVNKKSDGYNELDDEKVKEFFSNIKNKLLGKKSAGKPKDTKIPKKPKKTKIKGSKNPKKKSKFDFKGAGIKLIVILVFLGILIAALLFSQRGFNNLGEHTIEIDSSEDISMIVNEVSSSDDKIEFKATNNADISSNIVLNMKFTEKSKIPFMGKTIQCSSDIISLEPGSSLTEGADCVGLNQDNKYKLSIDVVELP